MEELPLEVRFIHHVEVHDPDPSDARRRKIEGERRAESARADQEHARVLELHLTLHSHLRHDEMAAVAPDLLGGEGKRRRGGGRSGRRRLRDRGLDPARHGGDDAQHVPFAERRVRLLQVAYVFVVHIHVHEGAQLAVFPVEVLLQLRMALDEALQRVPHGAGFDFHFSGPADKASERGRDQDLHVHSSSSGSKRFRSSLSTHDARPAGVPRSTLRIR